jgi:cysteine desulfurase
MKMPDRPIYLDYNATTPVDPSVQSVLLPYLREHFGNPSSTHSYGQKTHEAIEHARQQVANLLNALPEEIIFTGGGSEASNLAIKGIMWQRHGDASHLRGTQIISSAIEHPATLQPCQFLKKLGYHIEILPVDRFGIISLEALEEALKRPTALVTIMHSNNEVGTLQPIREMARLAHSAGALMHCDAAQSVGKLPVDVQELDVDLLSVAGHKLYAPKGIGALYVRQGVQLEPLIHGAGHESGRRAGTENVPYIVGIGAAGQIAQASLPGGTERLRQLRDRLWHKLKEQLGNQVVLNGHPEKRLPNTLNVSFIDLVGSELLEKTPTVAASTGSACHEGLVKLSPVLQAMGVDPELGKGAVRLTVGRFSTEEEIDFAAEALIKSAVSTLKC